MWRSMDVYRVLTVLLPPELAIQVLDHAGIWTSSVTKDIDHKLRCRDDSLLVTQTAPLTRIGASRLRQVIFRIESRDQGWSSDQGHRGTYEHSWTWFEARVSGLVYELQRNRHAGKEFERYEIRYGMGDELVDGLGEGSVIELWMCARYPGWMNRVSSAVIDMLFMDGMDGVSNTITRAMTPEMSSGDEERMVKLLN